MTNARELYTLVDMEATHMTRKCPIVLRLNGCQRCGDEVEHYVLRSIENGLFRVYVCEPCAEMLDRKDEAKRNQSSVKPFGPDWVHQKVDENERGYGRNS